MGLLQGSVAETSSRNTTGRCSSRATAGGVVEDDQHPDQENLLRRRCPLEHIISLVDHFGAKIIFVFVLTENPETPQTRSNRFLETRT